MNVEKIKSPAFIINKKILDENIQNIKNGCNNLNNKVMIGYSLKTNPTPFLIKYLVENNLYIEVVSNDEYNYAIDLGINPQKIIYNGPIKSKKTLLNAIKTDSIVNIDSFVELDWILDSNIHNKKIGIRINVVIDDELADCFEYSNEGSRFGFSINDDEILKNYIKRLEQEKSVTINGLHFHCNTKNRTPLIYKKIIEQSNYIIEKNDIKLDYIDIGGGYFGGKENDFHKYSDVIRDTLKKYNKLEKVDIIIEPGAAIIATAVSYFCKVIDKKNINSRIFITTDGSRIHIDPTFSNKKYKYTSSCRTESKLPTTLCGFTCMEKDRIKIDKNLDFLIGDYIIFDVLGAYTMSFIPNFICSYPNIYWYDNDLNLIVKKKKLRRYLE